jgi:hypothetical protein
MQEHLHVTTNAHEPQFPAHTKQDEKVQKLDHISKHELLIGI